MPDGAPPPAPLRVKLLAAAMAASLLLCGVSLAAGWVDAATIERTAAGGGAGAMVGYVLVVFTLQVFWFPRVWGLLAASVLFGPWLGVPLSMCADLSAAAFCYGLARGAARPWAAARLERRPKAKRMVELLATRRGATTMFLLRVLPVHWTGASYAAGVAGVPPRQFAIGTFLGVIPNAVLVNFVGDAARDPSSPVFQVGLVLLLIVFVSGSLWARRLWREESDQRIG